MSDPGTRLSRYRLIERLVEGASPAEDQIELSKYDGWYEELAQDYIEWSTTTLAELDRQGALSPKASRAATAVREALVSLMDEAGVELRTNGHAEVFTADGVRHDPRWTNVRALAKEALRAFSEMGIPIPRMSDEDFGVPRQDAP